MNVFLVQNKNVKNGFCNYDVDYSIKKERQFQTMMRVELKSLSTSDDVGMHDCNFLWYIAILNMTMVVGERKTQPSFLVLENQPATRKKSDVQGFMNDSGPKLSPEHDRLSWTGVRFGQLSLIGANWR